MTRSLPVVALLLLAACANRRAPRGCPPEPCSPPVARAPEPALPVRVPAEEATPPVDPAERAIELRRASKVYRWAKARDEVGLRQEQVDRLQAAVIERDASLEGKAWITTRLIEGLPLSTVMGDADEWRSHVEVGALEHADAIFDARAKEVLTAEQWAKWTRGGFSRAFGVRLPHVPRDPWAPTYVIPLPSAVDAPPRWEGLGLR
jgi:hypothetical protein